MINLLKRLHREEKGITALETAIILIAFVVVAAVFAFTILSAGTFSVEKGKEAVFAGLEEVRGSLESKGSMIAESSGGASRVYTVTFTLANTAGGQPIDMTVPTDSDSDGTISEIESQSSSHRVVIDYRDQNQRIKDLAWVRRWVGQNDGDDLLEDGEQVEISVPVSTTLASPFLGVNQTFALEVRPPEGGVLVMERTMPARLENIIDLH